MYGNLTRKHRKGLIKILELPTEIIEHYFDTKNSTKQDGTYLKLIVTGGVVEIYEHEKLPKLPGRKRDERNQKEFLEKYGDYEFDNSLTDRQGNQHKARNNLRRLITANFDASSKFITLTFKDNLTDVKQANYEFTKFIQRLRYKYGKEFKYANVIQFQDRGAVHYHMMSDLPYIPHKQLQEIWKNGFVYINKITHVDNVGAYMIRYMGKDMTDSRLMGEKSYMTSKNLERPREYVGDEAQMIIEALQLEDKKMVYNSSYTTEHLGLDLYKQYNLKR